MKNERPVLFRGEMVRAILDGRKTQTRRVIKPQPELRANGSVLWWKNDMLVPESTYRSPYGAPGDRLWVRESFCYTEGGIAVCHKENCTKDEFREGWWIGNIFIGPVKWRPPIHMPRWASRITLEVTAVRVERVQDISEEDALAEGVWAAYKWAISCTPILGFKRLWDSINAKRGYSFDSNPFVWVIEFRRITQ